MAVESSPDAPSSDSRPHASTIGFLCGIAVAACLVFSMFAPVVGIPLVLAIFVASVIAGGLRALTMCIATPVVMFSAAAIVLPAVLRPHGGGGNEASAIGSLRAINSGQASYSSTCVAGGYATDLADLVKPPAETSWGFVSPDLSFNGVRKSGYIVTLERDRSPDVTDVGSPVKTCNGTNSQPATSYFASANPIVPGETGRRYFATDARGTVFQSTKGPIQNPIPPGTDAVQ
jgi:hypothetical protein